MNRTELLNYLKGLPNVGALSGQHLDESDPQGSYNRLVASLPDVPAILGASPRVGASDDLSPNQTLFSILGDHATNGGIVMLEAHFANPWLPTNQQSIGSAWLSGTKPDLTVLAQTSGVTPAYLNFWAQVDRLVDLIKTLPDNALIILRLLHENNGAWFWWGVDNPLVAGKDVQQIKLYKQLQSYINAKVKQNPLWMHSGTALSYYAPCSYGRPDTVDLVGASLYRDALDWIHPQDLTDLKATGKPVFLSEAGPDVSKPQPGSWDTTKLLNVDKSVVGWQTWQDYTDPTNGHLLIAAVQNKNWQTLYADSHTVTRSKLPTSVTPQPPTPTPPTPVPSPPNPAPVPPLPSPSSPTPPNPLPRFYGPLP